MLTILRVLAMIHPLAQGVLETREPPPPSVAYVHALHAEAAATPDVPPELLLAIAYRESRYQPLARPQCGVTQIAARRQPRRCRRLIEDNQYAYHQAVTHLGDWLRFCRGRGIACALTGYGAGVRAARGKPSGYALRTLALARQIRGPR